MMRHTACLILLLLGVSARAADPAPTAEQIAFFESKVQPILAQHCVKCHGGEAKIKGGLRLTSRAETVKGGDTGSAFDAKEPGKSLLIKAIEYKDDNLQMPPKGKLAAGDIEVLIKWVGMGLPWTPGKDPAPPAAASHAPQVNEETKKFWSFQPVKQPALPAVKNQAWAANPVDAFVLAKLESAGLSPSAAANRISLIRRAYFDLTGLPPTPAEIDAFVADTDPKAYERIIDKLLASPHYGEKWGRHWLDLVRYAESNGYERDNPKDNAWKFRDYVIKSFNEDKPYDRFVLEQLAGDEIPDRTHDSIIATGFYRLGIWDDEPVDRPQAHFDGLDDMVSTIGQTMLGMTVGCARCHDHKIDPMPQADYYKLVAFVRNMQHEMKQVPVTTPQKQAEYEKALEANKDLIKAVTQVIEGYERKVFDTFSNPEKEDAKDGRTRIAMIRKKAPTVLTAAEHKDYLAKLEEKKKIDQVKAPAPEMALAAFEPNPNVPPTHVLIRGSAHNPGAEVKPGFPSVLDYPNPEIPKPAPGQTSSGRRTVLAKWIGSKDNKLTARVMVNRIWQHHFGRGIVRSTSNFGFAGDKPTHPELLDWLAADFMAGDWKMKRLHKLIMLSSAYRQSCDYNAQAYAKDPQNDLFWRFDMRRLTAEEMRDSVLAVTGTLNPKMAGPPIYPKISAEVLAGQSVPGRNWGNSSAEEAARRSIYIHIKRSLGVPILERLDLADTDNHCPVRFVTTQPNQALTLLNGDFMQEQATLLAARLKKEAGEVPAAQVAFGLRLTTGRVPTQKEIDLGLSLMDSLKKEHGVKPDAALKYFSLVALNLNEFAYLD